MGVLSFFRRIFTADTKSVNLKTFTLGDTDAFSVEVYALLSAVEMAANLVANCEFKTYRGGEAFKGLEWVSLNYKPNKNQSATAFWKEFYCKLLYSGEVLVVDTAQGRIIADSFIKSDDAIKEQSFTQVTRGDFTFSKTFKMSDVIYLQYNNQSAMQLKNSLFTRYGELCAAASDSYILSSGEKGVIDVSAQAMGDKKFEDNFKNLMDNYFKAYFKNKNAVVPLFGGMKYTPQTTAKGGTQIADIKAMYDDALMRASQAYMISPALVKGEIEGIKDALNLTLTVCVDPLANMASEELTSKEFTPEEIAAGDFIKADTSNIKHIDIFDIATSVDKLIASGFLSIDEAREAAALEPIGEEWSKKHYITKNYQDVNALELEGGDTENGESKKSLGN